MAKASDGKSARQIGLAECKKPRQAGCLPGLLRGEVRAMLRRSTCYITPDGNEKLSCSTLERAGAVISSTLPVPLMARCLGASDGSLLAQLL